MAAITELPLQSDHLQIRGGNLQTEKDLAREQKLRRLVRNSKVIVSLGQTRVHATKGTIALLSTLKARRVPERNPLARIQETIKSHLKITEAAVTVGIQRINAMLLRAGPKLDSSIEAPQALHPVVRKSVNLAKCG
jgi:hypothetical protein